VAQPLCLLNAGEVEEVGEVELRFSVLLLDQLGEEVALELGQCIALRICLQQ